jgi:hypothetical protein
MIRLRHAAIVMVALLLALPIIRLAAQSGNKSSDNDIGKATSGAELERSSATRFCSSLV